MSTPLLELSHTLGWSGAWPQAIAAHPAQPDAFFVGMGCRVVLCDTTDAMKQCGVDVSTNEAEVTALDASRAAGLLAVGTAGTAAGGHIALVRLHELQQETALSIDLREVRSAVTHVRFSPDGRFLAAATDAAGCGAIIVWDLSTGETVWHRRFGSDVTSVAIGFLVWGAVQPARRGGTSRPAYTLLLAASDRVHSVTLAFDLAAMTYKGLAQAASLPASGFRRLYSCAFVDEGTGKLTAGTTAGELVVYSLPPAGASGPPVYSSAQHAATHGVLSLAAMQLPSSSSAQNEAVLVVGGGDGLVASFRSALGQWAPLLSTRVTGRVVGLELLATGSGATAVGVMPVRAPLCLLVASSDARMYTVEGALLPSPGVLRAPAARLVSEGHPAAVLCLATVAGSAASTDGRGAAAVAPQRQRFGDVFATGCADGCVRLWDLNESCALCSSCTSAAGLPDALGVASVASAAASSRPGAVGTPGSKVLCVWLGPGVHLEEGPGSAGYQLRQGQGQQHRLEQADLQMYGGFADGTLRCFGWRVAPLRFPTAAPSAVAPLEWQARAHSGEVCALAGDRDVVVTGGADGRVCVWSRSRRLPIATFAEHSRPVTSVAVNRLRPHLIHSIAGDRQVVTCDTRTGRRMVAHTLQGSALAGGPGPSPASHFTTLSQWADPQSEGELLVGTSEGFVVFVDPDLPNPCGSVDVTPAWVLEQLHLLPGSGGPAGCCKDGAQVQRTHGAGGPPSAPELPTTTQRGHASFSRLSEGGRGSGGTALRSHPDRPCINAIQASPCGNYAVVGLSGGGLVVLGHAEGAVRPSAPVLQHAGTQSALTALTPVAIACVSGHITALSWTPDARQVLVSTLDARVTVLNLYGGC